MFYFELFILIEEGIYRLGMDFCCNNKVFRMDIIMKICDKCKCIKNIL